MRNQPVGALLRAFTGFFISWLLISP